MNKLLLEKYKILTSLSKFALFDFADQTRNEHFKGNHTK